MNECRGDRIYDDVSLICDKIEGVVVCFFFFTGKMEEEEEMEKGKRGGRLTGCNLKTNMDSPTNISDEFIFSVILSVIITHHFFHSFFFIPSFPTIMPSVYTNIKLLSVDTEEHSKEIFYQ